jgi:hypothetical protein
MMAASNECLPPETREPKPETRNPDLALRPENRNPKLETLRPENRNPKLETRTWQVKRMVSQLRFKTVDAFETFAIKDLEFEALPIQVLGFRFRV